MYRSAVSLGQSVRRANMVYIVSSYTRMVRTVVHDMSPRPAIFSYVYNLSPSLSLSIYIYIYMYAYIYIYMYLYIFYVILLLLLLLLLLMIMIRQILILTTAMITAIFLPARSQFCGSNQALVAVHTNEPCARLRVLSYY